MAAVSSGFLEEATFDMMALRLSGRAVSNS